MDDPAWSRSFASFMSIVTNDKMTVVMIKFKTPPKIFSAAAAASGGAWNPWGNVLDSYLTIVMKGTGGAIDQGPTGGEP
jgi:hypothetical protein